MTVTLTNLGPGPLELHLTAGVTVLRPRARSGCDPADLDLGQIRELCRQGVLRADTEEEPGTQAKARRARSAPKKPPAQS